MKIIHQRFRNSLPASLAAMRERRERFHRLLKDRPTSIRVRTRGKHSDADLRRHYRRRILAGSVGSAGLHILVAIGLPDLAGRTFAGNREPVVIPMHFSLVSGDTTSG